MERLPLAGRPFRRLARLASAPRRGADRADRRHGGAARIAATRDEALALALDQYVYCYDIVDQGTETVDALSAVLECSDYWFFWWD